MSSHIESCIGLLQEACDTDTAYFSYATDQSGELGVIRANKEGLRLYAMELLKKSVEMENAPASQEVLYFDDYDWLADDPGYQLISGIVPTTASRSEIINGGSEPLAATHKQADPLPAWLPSLIILSGGLIVVTIAALKWFH